MRLARSPLAKRCPVAQKMAAIPMGKRSHLPQLAAEQEDAEADEGHERESEVGDPAPGRRVVDGHERRHAPAQHDDRKRYHRGATEDGAIGRGAHGLPEPLLLRRHGGDQMEAREQDDAKDKQTHPATGMLST